MYAIRSYYLTGLPNRYFLHDRLKRAFSEAHKNKTHVAVLYLDLDKFKPVNDEYGHSVGDDVLVEVAVKLKKAVRSTDLVARVGGDEFVIVLENIEQAKDVRATAEKVINKIFEPMNIDGKRLIVGGSVGVGIYPYHALSPDSLLNAADKAMYEAKRYSEIGYRIHCGFFG